MIFHSQLLYLMSAFLGMKENYIGDLQEMNRPTLAYCIHV